MMLNNDRDFHLSYCTNIHPGESLDEVIHQLKSNVPELKKRLSPGKPFGIGLRLSAQAADELLTDGRLQEFNLWLDREDLYVFTMNGFPYGSFHRQKVKEQVYAPDWRTEERLQYSMNLAVILSRLLPEGSEGSISTSPLSYKYWMKDSGEVDEVYRTGTVNLARFAYEASQIKAETGVNIHLDIEPEPDCILENSDETVDFFINHLFPRGGEYLAGKYSLSAPVAEQMIRDHIQVCYDTCHFAVEFEEPAEAVRKFRQANIGIGKVQISAALKVDLQNKDRELIAEHLGPFVESTYLHQVVERQADGQIRQYRDLGEALPHLHRTEAREWRIHFHVPIFADSFEGLQSTQGDIARSLDIFKKEDLCRHFEIETYTWEVLPPYLKAELIDSIEREFKWALNLFTPG
ncbi:MAG: metabolite traffic protein EboE [Balneolales bacterium]